MSSDPNNTPPKRHRDGDHGSELTPAKPAKRRRVPAQPQQQQQQQWTWARFVASLLLEYEAFLQSYFRATLYPDDPENPEDWTELRDQWRQTVDDALNSDRDPDALGPAPPWLQLPVREQELNRQSEISDAETLVLGGGQQ